MTQDAFASEIYTLRDEPVVLGSDLALLYGVKTRVFNQAIRRNQHRFPTDFAFQLSRDEWSLLGSQIVILNCGQGKHRKYFPSVFTELGANMGRNDRTDPGYDVIYF
jgi:ORF6N domain